MQRPNSARKKSIESLLTNIMVMTASLIISILLAELFFRVYLSYQGDSTNAIAQYDWYLGDALPKPPQEGDTNYLVETGGVKNFIFSREFDKDYAASKGSYKILILGDSFTEGMGVRNRTLRFSRQLQEKLGDDFAVFNLAWPGSDIVDYDNIAKLYFANHTANLTMIVYFPNDIDRDVLIPLEDREIVSMQENSRKYAIMHFIKKSIETRSHMYLNYYISAYADGPSLARHGSFISKMIKRIKDSGSDVLIVSLPFLYQMEDFERYPLKHEDEFLKGVAEINDAFYLDTLPTLSRYRPQQLWVSSFDHHLNALGHRIVADAIYDKMKEMNLTEEGK